MTQYHCRVCTKFSLDPGQTDREAANYRAPLISEMIEHWVEWANSA